MRIKNIILSILAGGSLAVGGSLAYRRRKRRLEETRRDRERMRQIVALALLELAGENTEGRVSASEIYFFVWIVERVARRHELDIPSFNFEAKQGMLTSSKLTFVLRQMLNERLVRLDGNYLTPEPQLHSILAGREMDKETALIIEETVAQWRADFPDEPLVRFGQLFK
ncbi:MAG: hypothetical protein A3F83_16725 [Candidatus Glassbacteria bacterium RIFCSPLOWO2_12_FULL_58_11]|uniref:Uncharacterized protein n=1 Tax=Candidatus Glassbacteria bacterium RIFCSPLOWO2_12_FULL_58_11 TaxID=1817867 RepID=A0A1F5YP83_9BACT|nr:MAG: hypothetical protein A3F83_16725 [Candidatus Glassbacteria bacterium RIFCSPLOWO2_12_FULL_58_11]